MECVGLSEELEIVRRVVERNYVVLAVTSADTRTGCWSDDLDVPRLRFALQEFIRAGDEAGLSYNKNQCPTVYAIGASSGGYMAARMLLLQPEQHHQHSHQQQQQQQQKQDHDQQQQQQKQLHSGQVDDVPVSVDAALVMVMGLAGPLVQKLESVLLLSSSSSSLLSSSTPGLLLSPRTTKRLYFAPMTRDVRTSKLVRENVRRFIAASTHGTTTASAAVYAPTTTSASASSADSNNIVTTSVVLDSGAAVALDETSCRPLPVTVEYLWHRVVGMTKEAAHVIVEALVGAGHMDATTGLLILDPTRSDWRDVLLARTEPMPQSLQELLLQQQQQQQQEQQQDVPHHEGNSRLLGEEQQQQQQPGHSQVQHQPVLLWRTFDLTPGRSPLAKALHRAWAYHEYCSEAVDRALDFFELPSSGG